MSPTNILRLGSRRSLLARPQTFQAVSPIRPLSQTPHFSAKKNNQDRESIDTESSEHTKSSTDDSAAADKAAFDPNNTSPEGEMKSADGGEEGAGNPLDVSGANQDVSKQNDPQKGGAEKSPKEGSGAKQSGGGSPKKGQAT